MTEVSNDIGQIRRDDALLDLAGQWFTGYRDLLASLNRVLRSSSGYFVSEDTDQQTAILIVNREDWSHLINIVDALPPPSLSLPAAAQPARTSPDEFRSAPVAQLDERRKTT